MKSWESETHTQSFRKAGSHRRRPVRGCIERAAMEEQEDLLSHQKHDEFEIDESGSDDVESEAP
jgi:hypothetical protein